MFPPIKRHGGKFRLKDFIVSNLPSDIKTYCEPFCGGCNILLNAGPYQTEILCDMDEGLINLLSRIQTDCKFLQECLLEKVYCKETFEDALTWFPGPYTIKDAIKYFIVNRMSRGGLGKNFSWQDRLRGGQPGSINEWQNAIKNLTNISERLKKVFIFEKDFRDVIKIYNHEDTFLYLDPPYLPETRTAKSCYSHEMSYQDHVELLELLVGFKGRFLLSGYESDLYDETGYRFNWWSKSLEVANNSGQNNKKQKRTEVLWGNYELKD